MLLTFCLSPVRWANSTISFAKLAENLHKFLEGADSFQMVEGNQDLRGAKRSGWYSEQTVSDLVRYNLICFNLLQQNQT